jgi:hypothetical protein
MGMPATLDHRVLKGTVNELCAGTGKLECVPPGVLAVFLNHKNIDAIVASMSECNEWRILLS